MLREWRAGSFWSVSPKSLPSVIPLPVPAPLTPQPRDERSLMAKIVEAMLPTTASRIEDRNRQPLDACRGLDAIAIGPVAFHKLRTVIRHVPIAAADEVKKSLPRNITGLDDRNAQAWCLELVGCRVRL